MIKRIFVLLIILTMISNIYAWRQDKTNLLIGLTAPTSVDGDDQGPPEEKIWELIEKTGITLLGCDVRWGDCEKNDPGDEESSYDWSSFDKQESLKHMKPGRQMMASINLNNPWADKIKEKEFERWRKLAVRFVKAFAEHAREKGVRYFHAPGNESSLLARADWATFYMETAKIVYEGVKSANPDNQVVVGALVCGCRDIIEALYQAGLKGNFDVMDIHAYGDSTTFVSIDQIIETHKVLAEHGDGDKKIFLGEGWSCFPLPQFLENKKGHEQVTEAEIEHYKQAVRRGYRNLITPRKNYDPNWILGARYFVMNDFWQGMHWLERAVLYKDKNGKPTHWILDGYYVPYKPGELDPHYRCWGFVDVNGNPKGDTIYEFPPYIPKHDFTGEIEDLKDEKVNLGKEYKIILELTNKENEPFFSPNFNILIKDQRLKLKIKKLTPDNKNPINPGEKRVCEFLVFFPENLEVTNFRIIGEFFYVWEKENYYSDVWIEGEIKQNITVWVEPNRLEINPDMKNMKNVINLKIRNNGEKNINSPIIVESNPYIDIKLQSKDITVLPGEEKSIEAEIVIKKLLPIGREEINFNFSKINKSTTLRVVLIAKSMKTDMPKVIDGMSDDWDLVYPILIEDKKCVKEKKDWKGINDCSAKVYSSWDNEGLYFLVYVKDDKFVQNQKGFDVWKEDSLQIAIDPKGDGDSPFGGYRNDDLETVFALTKEGPEGIMLVSSKNIGKIDRKNYYIRRDKDLIIYEIKIPLTEFSTDFAHDFYKKAYISFQVNDEDGNGRKYLEWGGGTGEYKSPSLFVPMFLVN